MPWEGPYKVGEVYDNNIIQLWTLNNEEMGRENVNKLKFSIFPNLAL